MAGAHFKWDGMDELQRILTRAPLEAVGAMASALYVEGSMLVNDAKRETPVDQGTLRNSGIALPPSVSGTSIEVVVGFGGAASDYAVAQHEHTEFRHQVGKAKFLKDPADRRETGFDSRIAALAGRRLFGRRGR